MPSICLEGIVTNYSDYKDYDRIITLFTIERGRVDARARGCRRSTSKLLAGTQLFAFCEYELFYSKDKYSVNACELKESFYPLREDIDRFTIAMKSLRLAGLVVQKEDENRELFKLIYHILSFLSYGNAEPDALFSAYLLHYLNIAGYRPAITHCAVCGRDLRVEPALRFSARRGGALCSACAAGAMPIGRIALEAMRRILLLPVNELDRVALKPELLNEISSALRDYTIENVDGSAAILR